MFVICKRQDNVNFIMNIIIKQYFLLFIVLFCQSISAQNTITNTLIGRVADCMISNGVHFIDAPYKAGTLDIHTQEQLTYCNDTFDCVTFVEYVLALSLYQTQATAYNISFDKILQDIRYRNGTIDGYSSRIHYFTEWILQQEKNGILTNVTASIGGEIWNKKIDFMSVHTDKYPKLTLAQDIAVIKEAEKKLSNTTKYIIPKTKVKSIYSQLQNGDIIAIATNIKGLDIVHTGIVIFKNGTPHLLHASESSGKVVISPESLSDYLLQHSKQVGIIVSRCR